MTLSFIELSPVGLLSVSGPDAFTFLQGQLTCDLNDLMPGKNQLGAHCNLKGRMQSLSRVILIEENNYLLRMPLSMVDNALQNLKKYALFSKVTLVDVSQQYRVMGIVGTGANAFVNSHNWNEKVHIVEISPTPERLELLSLSALNIPMEAQPMNWDLLDIQSGIPAVYPETMDAFLPHHVNLFELGGIGLKKGCYLGQEIIARMHYKGNIKKHLVHAYIEDNLGYSLPQPGDPVIIPRTSSEAPGIIVRAAVSDKGFECLLVIDGQYANLENAHLYSETGPMLKPI